MKLGDSFRNPSTAQRYVFAVLAIILATAARFSLSPFLGATSPFTLYFPTIILCAWFGGVGPSLFATAASALLGVYYFLPPYYTLGFGDSTAIPQLLLFLAAGTLISGLAGSLHRSKRVAQESALKESEERERFRVTLDSIGDAVIATDPQGRVTFLNSVAESLTGWPFREAVGRPLTDVFKVVDEGKGNTLEAPRSSKRETAGEPASARVRQSTLLVSRNGTRTPIDDSNAPIRGAGGETLGTVLVFRDVGESRKLEKERAQLAEIVASSEDAIISKSLKGIIESWNDAAERMFGYTAREAIGQSITIIIPPERREEEKAILARINEGERVDHFETVRVAKDGHQLDISLTVSPVRDAYGRVMGASKIARDITQRKRDEQEHVRLLASEREAREQAEAASRSKDEFVAMVSHEIRSPLNAILGWVQLLQTGKMDNDKTARALETIERNARIQAQLVDDLLDISRVITGKLQLDVRPVEPSKVVQTTIESIRPAAEARSITLRIRLAATPSLVAADPARLQQIFWNLLSNAVKFTPANGLIEVSLERIGPAVQIVVRDSGAGISADFLPYIFDRFSQASTGSGRKHGGLGLGLAIVRHLVELHGGTVLAESPGEGQGATFTVTLPAARRETLTADERFAYEAVESPESAIQLNGLHILVVDDETEMRELLITLLAQHGAQVTATASAAEALELIEREQFSLLISDIGMPAEDGYSLMRKIRARAQDRSQRLPSIALTGFARTEDRTRALAAGFQMYVSKPVDATELLTVIASLTGRFPPTTYAGPAEDSGERDWSKTG